MKYIYSYENEVLVEVGIAENVDAECGKEARARVEGICVASLGGLVSPSLVLFVVRVKRAKVVSLNFCVLPIHTSRCVAPSDDGELQL
jgi:hypothetical protein